MGQAKTDALTRVKKLRDLCLGRGDTRITGILLAAVTQRDTGIRYLIYQVWKRGRGQMSTDHVSEAVWLQGGAFRM